VPSPAGVLFPQVTESPSREFIAAQLQAAGCTSLVVPRAGRFAVAAAAVPVLGAKNITCYDTGLIPSLLGYLADPARGLDDLPVTVPDWPGIRVFTDDPASDYDRAAGIMLAVRYLAMPRDTAYMAEQARAVRGAAAGLRSWLAAQLAAQSAQLAGIRYRIGPGVAPLAEPAAPGEAVFADLRGLATRTRRELTAAEQQFWDEPPDPAAAKDIPVLLEALAGRDQLAVACVTGARHIPPGWVRLAAAESGGGTDYVIASRDPGGRLVKTRRRPGDAGRWPLYAEQEIRPDSQAGVVCVDKDTAVRYRDLLVHRLDGTTVSERYYLLTVDGRVTTVFGLHFRDQVTGKTDYCAETFGITITSQRYARLGKLFMLCLTSRDMLAFLLHTSPNMLQRNPPAGLQTSSPTVGHEGKADRGVMRLVSREPRPGGGFHLVYRTEWRDESWAQTVARWHREQAWITRPGWDGPRLPQPQAPAPKRRRGRGRQEDRDDA
jgi:hypothetical protein